MFARSTVKRDYYEVLSINRNADETAIKRAYRSLAMKYHPDRNQGDAETVERMKEINEAYAVLTDAHKRQLYDTYGHAGLEGYTQADIFRGVDFSDIFNEFGLGDIFGFGDNLFDSFIGRRTTTRRGPRKGADLRYELKVTLEEVAFGTKKAVELPKMNQCQLCSGSGAEPDGMVKCENCSGTGQIVKEQSSGYSMFRQISVCGTCRGKGKVITKPCKECEGKGIKEKINEVQINIPAGANSGHAIRIEGEGEKGEDLPGDLYIVLNVEKHPVFERHDDNIYLQQEIAFTTATLGGEIAVPTLNGEHKLEIPEGTQTSTVLRIENEGIPHLHNSGRGDEYIILKVVTPTNLSRKEKELLREFQRLKQRSGSDHPEQSKKV
jgi:molecular chaperone DnaJ